MLLPGDQADATVAGIPDRQLIEQLAGPGRSQGLRLTDEGGLLAKLTEKLAESASEGVMNDHPGYA